MKKVLVSGAGGYIGTVLVSSLLKNGYEVVALDRFFFGIKTLPTGADGLRLVRNDIRWMEESCFDGVDAVVDLAALSNDPSGELDPQKTWEINHLGRVKMAQTAKRMGVKRYILPSSCSVYGFQEGLLDETSLAQPLTTYAQANLKAEEDVLQLADKSFCVVVLRQATVYGLSSKMRFDLAINGMVKGFFKNGKIPVLRDGSQWRPFVHVKDTTHAMLTMLEAPKDLISGQIFNVGSDDQNVQILPLARLVAEAIGVPFSYEWYGQPDHRSYRVSFRKIHDLLEFRTKFTPQDGAREIYSALQRHELDPDDPKTITVQWYKHLMEMQEFLREVEIDGVLI